MTRFSETARRTDLFAGLDQDELDGLARRIETVEAREGQVIFAEGAAADRVYLIGSGTVRIGKGRGMRAGTYARYLATLQPGDVFGEMALVLDSPRTAAAVAVTPCELFAFSRVSFDAVLANPGGLGTKVLRNMATMLCLRLQRADDALIGLQERSSAGALGPSDLDTVHARLFRSES
jgi:CRP-like cAMP-binding protein